MEFKVTDEQARKLEAYHYEYMSLKTLVETLATSELPVNLEVFAGVKNEFKIAYMDFNIAYNTLLEQYVPVEFRNNVEFIFSSNSFILKQKTGVCSSCG